MNRCWTVLLVSSFLLLSGRSPATANDERGSVALQAFADGIGDLTFASTEWVDAAQEAFGKAVADRAAALDGVQFTMCLVAHNPPAYLHSEGPLAYHVKFDGADVQVAEGELSADECDLKIEGDHSMMSNLAHIQYHDRDPEAVAAAQERFRKLSRWEISGSELDNDALKAVLRAAHDELAGRAMPRLIWATPEWTSLARHIVCTRARNPELNEGLNDVSYTFSEVFYDPPKYASPDGTAGGFWVHCNHGVITVGSGPLPKELEPADYQSRGPYVPILPIGRTVEAAMTDANTEEKGKYTPAAFSGFTPPESEKNVTPATGKRMPPALGRCMMVLHDELSKRTSGELPLDYDQTLPPQWSQPQAFDRDSHYDASWVKYDQFDLYGQPL